jgi:hypothetical protein
MTSRKELPVGIQLCLEDLEKSTVNAYGVIKLLASTDAIRKSSSLVSELERSLGEPRRDVETVSSTSQRGYGGHEILEVARQFVFLVGGGTLLTGTFTLIGRWLSLNKDRKASIRYESGDGAQVRIDLSGFTEEGAIELVKQLTAKAQTGPQAPSAAASVHPERKETEPGPQWDVFLSYARGDAASSARELHDHLLRLKPDITVFLDAVALTLGDNWDSQLKTALESSRLVAALVSPATETAYFQREELITAIDLARKNPDVRVIPVYLDERSSESPPLGLRCKQSIHAQKAGGLEAVARELLRVLSARGRGTPRNKPPQRTANRRR